MDWLCVVFVELILHCGRVMNPQLDIPMTDVEAREALDSMDTDGNGYIELDEFLGFFKRKASEIAQSEVRWLTS